MLLYIRAQGWGWEEQRLVEGVANQYWECAFGPRPYHLFWGTPYSGGGSHGGSDEVASDE
jgi:hypothetical protein